MNTWYNQYYVPPNNNYKSQFNDIVIKLTNRTKNIGSKVSDIEKDYDEKMLQLVVTCSDVKEIEKIKLENSLVILQKELDIIKLLTKYSLLNNNLEYDFFISCLNMLLELSETLRQRLKQKSIIHNIKDDELNISRCSYKFCSYKENCTYNYNPKSKNLCYQDHFVHNMVSTDLKILIDYINENYEKNNIILHNKEILKTINTLSFVITHMEIELRTKCLYLPESEWESCHVTKNK